MILYKSDIIMVGSLRIDMNDKYCSSQVWPKTWVWNSLAQYFMRHNVHTKGSVSITQYLQIVTYAVVFEVVESVTL